MNPEFVTASRPLLDDRVVDQVFVEELLKELTPRELEIVRLRYWKDLSCGTVAEILGEKERGAAYHDSTIRYHEKKLLKKLRDILRKTSESP